MTSPDDLVAWTFTAAGALWGRHLPAHSIAVKTWMATGWADAPVHLRTGDLCQTSRASMRRPLVAVAFEVVRVTEEGHRLDCLLRHNPRPGVYRPNAVTEEGWAPTCLTDEGGADMPRPTAEELDSWWGEYGPFPTLA